MFSGHGDDPAAVVAVGGDRFLCHTGTARGCPASSATCRSPHQLECTPHGHHAVDAAVRSQAMKGSQKPKKMGKKPAQKSLKERRSEKRAAAKTTRSLDV